MAEGIELATLNTRYFCHHCSREVSPLHTVELTCPDCSSGFLEELSRDLYVSDEEYESDRDSDELSMLNALSINNLISRTLLNVTGDDISNPFELSHQEGSSFQDALSGFDDHEAESFLHFRHLGDYLFGDDLDALATQLLNEAEISGPPPLPKEQIKLLPTIIVTKEHVEKGIQCTVCMDDFNVREKAKCLPCEHFYHEKCITPWLERHSTCPNCRKVVDTQSRSRRSRSCPRTNLRSTNGEHRRFSESSSISEFFSTNMNPFRFL